ncbi:MAG: hypothetical protein KDB80_00345 [Planctomycetes bacterium]|nr:hypothetical protein [Planctomycetota bacterium]
MDDAPAAQAPTRLSVWIGALLIITAGAALLVPFLDRPWTANEANAGAFYGSFNVNYERFGFWHMYGLEAGPIAHELKASIGYLNHPPAMAWLIYFAGMDEWQMRLPTVVSVIVLGLLVFAWLTPRIGVLSACAAGIIVQLPPTMSVHGQISYELTTAVLGWGMIMAFDRVLARGRFTVGTSAVTVLCAFAGPWFDWSFLYVYCPALVPLMWRRVDLSTGVRRLAVPATSATVSLALLLWWRVVVSTADHLPAVPDHQTGLWEIYSRTLAEFAERGLGDTLRWTWFTIRTGFTLPLLVIAGIGLLPMLRRVPRVVAVLSLAFVHPALFPSHAIDHPMFFVYAAPLVAISAACAAAAIAARLPQWVGRIAQAGVLAVAIAAPAISAWSHLENTTQSFYKDLGSVLTAAVEHDNWEAGEPLGYNVGHSWPYGAYHAYLDSTRVVGFAVVDAKTLAAAPAGGAPRGLRYLWLRYGEVPAFAKDDFAQSAELEALLNSFPRKRVPILETRVDVTGRGDVVEIREAWLVTLREPG